MKSEPFEIKEVDRVGAGDAFDAGFICGCMSSSVQRGLDYGLTVVALKHAMPRKKRGRDQRKGRENIEREAG